jgi:type IV pilus assembly protein PilA
MFCSKCGATMPDIAAACPQCGAAVASAPPAPAPAAAAAPAPGRVAPAQWQPAPPARPYPGHQETEGKAVGSLILGILAMFPFGFLTGIPAIILGHLSRKSIRESLGRLRGEGMALAGLIMGYISIAFIPVVLIMAAIAIPGLLRSRILANESAAARTVGTFSTAQALYANKYPSVGYARDLATLGMGSAMHCSEAEGTSEHACLIDRPLGSPNCTSGSWCVKSGYQFEVTATCGSDGVCSDYVATATPVQPGTSGRRSFCSTSDTIIRAQPEGSAALPGTTAECQSWPPL